jgi:hypothetical protein
MNTFANAVSNIAMPSVPMSKTANGAATYEDSGNALTSLFFCDWQQPQTGYFTQISLSTVC